MTQISFFQRGEGLSLADLVQLCSAELGQGVAGDTVVTGLAGLAEAGPSDLGFFDNLRYSDALTSTKAGCVILTARNAKLAPEGLPVIIARDPNLAFTLAGRALFPQAATPAPMAERDGIAASAFVDPSARLEDGVTVEPTAFVGPRVAIGSGSIIGPGAVIGAGCQIGRNCSIGPQVTVQHALIGNHVILHSGVRIGQDGFGYSAGRDGIVKSVQIGRVIIQDHVEVGANTTIDRGAIRDTVIGEHTKIDNQVQIAHNVRIGRNCFVVSQVGLAGSATLGDGVAIGGQSGVNGHLIVGDGAQIAAVTSVASDVPPGARWGGVPAKPIRDWFRELTWLSEMAKVRRIPGGKNGRRDDDDA